MALNYKNKKGNMAYETIGAIIIIAAIGLIFFLSSFITSNFNEGIQNSTAFNNQSKEVINNVASKSDGILNNMIVFFFVVSWIAALIAAWFSNESPVFLVISIIIYLLVIIAAVYVQNGIQAAIENPVFANQYENMPMLVFMINNMLTLIILYGVTVGAMLYARSEAT